MRKLRSSTRPTAAFRRFARKMRAAVKKMLSAITIMLAMFASEPSVPAVWMPQVGLTPTGAEAESAETPWRRLLSARWTWGKSNRQ